MSGPRPAQAAAFDLTGPLPTGTAVLEASAGTGKTFTIAGLATRYVAEGHSRVDELLMITFGRQATRELRERVREALTAARDALSGQDRPSARANPTAGAGRFAPSGAPHDDPVIAMLRALPPGPRAQAAARLGTAVAQFDAATIATTHEFARRALAELGLAADVDPGETFVEDLRPLVDEVVDDLYVRKYGPQGAPHPADLALEDARALARAVVQDPQAQLFREGSESGPDATRVRFGHAVRDEVDRRRRAQRRVTFDDLTLRLEAALLDPVTGPRAADLLRDRYRVVLVDEFQDTDPAQWSIVRTAFHGRRTLVLIGDPKQAIYAFRGADVVSYLTAVEVADVRATLTTNYRSDAPVVTGIQALLSGMALGDPRIVVTDVGAHHVGSRLVDPRGPDRVRLRLVRSPEPRPPAVGESRALVAADVAADVVATLSGPVRLAPAQPHPPGGGDGPLAGTPARPHPPGGLRALAPGDLAVLVGTNRQGDLVHEALAAVEVPSVVSAPRSVFATDAARQWRTLLQALDSPRRATLRAAALTDFLGIGARDLGLAGDALDERVGTLLRGWARIVESQDVAALLASLSAETGLMPRVLSRPDGERQLTDLRQVAGALHAQQRRSRVGVPGLLDWLDDQIERAAAESVEQATERTRRLETDADAVQILTVHRSKGLEFPVVYVPFAWDRPSRPADVLRCHHGQQRVLDVRTPGAAGFAGNRAAHNAEEDGESLRLLYVAMTRAASSLVLHWAPSARNTEAAALTRVLGARAAGHTVPEPAYRGTPSVRHLTGVAIEEVPDPPSPARWAPPGRPPPTLAAAPYTRTLDTAWRRTSYTGLTAGSHGQSGGEAPPGLRDDEPPDGHDPGAQPPPTSPPVGAGDPTPDRGGPPDPDGAGQGGPAEPSPFAGLPAGAAFGSLVHETLEAIDTSTDDLADEVRRRCAERLLARPMPGLQPDRLADALLPVLGTPLGPLADHRTLASVLPRDRLAELDFELPLGQAGAAGTLGGVADLLRAHLPAGDPLADYPDRLRTAGLAGSLLRGYLTGSIDAVLRLGPPHAGSRAPRFLVVDYKTTLLGAREGPDATVWDYRPSLLPAAMMAAHYPLQALLYSAALHRFLRWRLPRYDPEQHLGGVLYLYLRGMAGPRTPSEAGMPSGVFAWRPPPPLVVALSDLLDGGRP